MAPGADIGVAAIQGVLKVTQSTLFGAVMALLVVRSPYGSRPFPQRALSLMAPVIVHGLFDLLFWGPHFADRRRAALYLPHGQSGRSRTFGDHNGSAGMGRKIMLGFAHEQN